MHLFLILPLALLVSFIYLTVMTAAVIYMQPDYFIKKRTTRPVKETHKWAWLIVKVFKNVIGLFLILAGIIMLVTPGQGLLTILIGLFFMDFPGKRKLEISLVRKPAIHKSMNWLRKKAGSPPIEIP